MTTKYDLSLVPYDQIFAEFQRRYPTGVLAIIHPIDGKPGVGGTRLETWGRSGIEILGLAELAYRNQLKNVMGTLGALPAGGMPLEGPDKPVPPPIAQ